jgi:hypothetical protein|uniref:Uncharacterized protein n=1 Tax=Micromonas commoda virus TaxID=3057169 RepID=A0AAU7YN39_9PHYC
MELHEATYIVCMLIVHVVRNVGKLSLEEKLNILQYAFSLLRSLDLSSCKIYSCTNKPRIEYTTE